MTQGEMNDCAVCAVKELHKAELKLEGALENAVRWLIRY
jgi:hypothetical protein